MSRTVLVLWLVLAGALLAPAGAGAQGGAAAPDLSDPCPVAYPGDAATNTGSHAGWPVEQPAAACLMSCP